MTFSSLLSKNSSFSFVFLIYHISFFQYFISLIKRRRFHQEVVSLLFIFPFEHSYVLFAGKYCPMHLSRVLVSLFAEPSQSRSNSSPLSLPSSSRGKISYRSCPSDHVLVRQVTKQYPVKFLSEREIELHHTHTYIVGDGNYALHYYKCCIASTLNGLSQKGLEAPFNCAYSSHKSFLQTRIY